MDQFVIKSFGYGITMVESVGQTISKSKYMKEVIYSMFPDIQEWIDFPNNENRAIFMIQEGHKTTKYELGQLEFEDWKLIQEIVKESGSPSFSLRLSMLNEYIKENSVVHS